MREDRSKDGALLVLVVAGLVAYGVSRHAVAWLASAHRLLRHTAGLLDGGRLLVLVGALGLLAAVVLLLRRLLSGLRSVEREGWSLLASPEFDPPADGVARFASQLVRTRRRGRGWLERSTSATRVGISDGEGGRLSYRVDGPAHAQMVLRTALGAYPEVELHEDSDLADARQTSPPAVTQPAGLPLGEWEEERDA